MFINVSSAATLAGRDLIARATDGANAATVSSPLKTAIQTEWEQVRIYVYVIIALGVLCLSQILVIFCCWRKNRNKSSDKEALDICHPKIPEKRVVDKAADIPRRLPPKAKPINLEQPPKQRSFSSESISAKNPYSLPLRRPSDKRKSTAVSESAMQPADASTDQLDDIDDWAAAPEDNSETHSNASVGRLADMIKSRSAKGGL